MIKIPTFRNKKQQNAITTLKIEINANQQLDYSGISLQHR